MLKPFKPYLRWLPVAAGVLVVAAPALILIARSEPPSRGTGTTVAPASAQPKPDKALAAPGEIPPIVYAGNRPGTYQLFAIGPAGGRPVQVTGEPALYPTWSPDGKTLAFVGEATGYTSRRLELSLIASDATITSVLKGAQVPSHPTFRRDGTLAYQSTIQEVSGAAGVTGRSSIDTVDITERRQRTILRNRGAAYQPAWSPDGRRLAVVLGNASCDSERLCRQRLVLWHPHEDRRQTLVRSGSAAAPAWSPDGAALAFTWDRGKGPAIWVLRLRDRVLEQVTSGSPADAEPTWSPDGRRIAFMRRCDIFVQRLGAPRATNLTRSRDACEISPAWRPSS